MVGKEMTKDMIAIMQAYVDGKTIEYRLRNDDADEWETNMSPGWNWTECEYRMKKEPREFYAAALKINSSADNSHLFPIPEWSKGELNRIGFKNIIKVREVLDDEE